MTGTKMTTKQVNPVHVHPDTSRKAPLGATDYKPGKVHFENIN